MRTRELLAFAAPSLAVGAVLLLFPIGLTIAMSFARVPLGGQWSAVGFENYSYLLGSDRFWRAAAFTLGYALVVAPLAAGVGLGLALILLRTPARQATILFCLILPLAAMPTVASLLFGLLVKSPFGLVPWLLAQTGARVDFLGTSTGARAVLVAYGIWHATPIAFIVLYSALLAVPRDLISAARVDGASYMQSVRVVVLPAIAPALVVAGMMLVIDAMRLYEPSAIITQGTGSTESLSLLGYSLAFGQRDLGRGSAVATVSSLLTLALLLPFLLQALRRTSDR